ncbi:MAG TPA: zf-HC2 domain-containing protein [Vicinamibacterales bacterium]|nr:zf-HC2 domain-containing protein [Vicinamibacterales bacterium]
MCDKELLIGYLYDELEAPARLAFEQHLESCQPCRDDLEDLRAARTHLASWVPPEADLGYEIVRTRAVTTPRFRLSPAWGLAAAAVLVLAAASAIANVEIRAGGEGLVVRTGWNRAEIESAAPATIPQALQVSAPAADLQQFDRRLRELEAELARAARVTGAPAGPSESEVMRRVSHIVLESETRQQRELATRIGQVVRELDALHRADLVRLQQSIAQSQRLTDAEVLQQKDLVNQMFRLVSTQR